MVTYKNHDFLKYMADVQRYDRNISALNDQWENIKLLCEINCPSESQTMLPNMQKIQDNFYQLQQKLIDALVEETVKKMDQKIISKAQVAVDILIRNLYERTADVGFLATDDDIRDFVCHHAESREYQQNVFARLREYVAKYSVYEDVIILDRNCNVILNLDRENPVQGTTISDPILERTLVSTGSYVESFRFSPLQASKRKAHIFSSRIYGDDGEVAGIICLCFRFENEMERIFRMLSTDYDGSVMMIIDADGTVLSTSDENHVPVGIIIEPADKGENEIVYYRGVEYIAKTVSTQGYQGYYGLGWRGHVMIPLHLAFKEKENYGSVNRDMMTALMNKADSFSSVLEEIINQTKGINHSLRRIVYNGQIISEENADDEFLRLKPILNTIGQMGGRTSSLFQKSVQNLFSTVISASLVDVGFTASLCVDIMDRNLYERADDCRWWALNSTFRTILAEDKISKRDLDKLSSILAYIHSLYTIYSNLFLFDRTGTIVAVSNPDRTGDIGKTLTDSYIQDILRNTRAEQYYVSPYEATDLYDGKYTYIYGASVTDPKQEKRTVGGIGIVFDSDLQFRTMLTEEVKSKESTVAIFADRDGKIISASDPELRPGDLLDLPSRLLKTPNGARQQEILLSDGKYYAVGCACSSSYREYKNTDGYHNDVLAFVLQRLADDDGRAAVNERQMIFTQKNITLSPDQPACRLVIFEINGQPFALDQRYVLEAVEARGIIYLPGTDGYVRGAIVYGRQYIPVVNTHAQFFNDEEHPLSPHFLILRYLDNAPIAIEADELDAVVEINESHIRQIPDYGIHSSALMGIVDFSNGDATSIVVVLNHEMILQNPKYNDLNLASEEFQTLLRQNPAEQPTG